MRRAAGRHVRSNIVGYLALFVALGGSASAAFVVSSNSQIGPGTVSGGAPPAGAHANLISGSVTTGDLKASAVTRSRLANTAVDDSKVGPDALTGAAISEASLGK